MKRKKRILILISEKTSPTDKNWTFFRNAVSKSLGPDYEVTMGELKSLTFEMSESDSKVYDRIRGFSLGDFDLVIFRFVRKMGALASSCASYLLSKNIPYIDSQVKPGNKSKYAAQALRHAVGFLNIPSINAQNSELEFMIANNTIPIPYPLIIKDNMGKKGRLNFIAHNKTEALDIINNNPEVDFIVQKYIENDGDFRFLVFGDKISLIIHRKAKNGSHLNNTSQGAVGSIADIKNFSEKIISDVKLAAKLEHLEVAGVDLMIEKNTGRHYIIEVNSSPQLASGAVPEAKIKSYTDYISSLL